MGASSFFLKKLGVGMLHMRSGGLQIFVQKIGGLVFFGYHKKTDCYYNDIDKRSGELSGPSDLCSTFRSLAVAFGKTFTLDLKFDMNQSAEVGSLCKPGATIPTRITWDPFDILNILKCTNYSIYFKIKTSKMSQSL